MDLLGETRAPRDAAKRRAFRDGYLYRSFGIGRGQTKTADKNGEAQIGRLAKLPAQERKKSGAPQHEGKNLTALEFA